MVEEELEQLEVLMANEEDGPLAVGLAANFLNMAGFQLAPLVPANQEPDLQDIVYEDDLDAEDGACHDISWRYGWRLAGVSFGSPPRESSTASLAAILASLWRFEARRQATWLRDYQVYLASTLHVSSVFEGSGGYSAAESQSNWYSGKIITNNSSLCSITAAFSLLILFLHTMMMMMMMMIAFKFLLKKEANRWRPVVGFKFSCFLV
ncbi:hypothetical protein DCAR_0727914 [Daucus carota subsp. sativus]|uniref:Uncharacterized protein n=1 Tax=Daucus carota subsp. sativus TaxID=79200 RepID=A0A161ZLN0_DAUCS|nr:hypothetical protein DCAR_0727914 [Daucus carota subsp. sativus]